MEIMFKLLLIGLAIWVPMLILDVMFNISDRKTNRNKWYARTGAAVMNIDLVGWVLYAMACIWFYA